LQPLSAGLSPSRPHGITTPVCLVRTGSSSCLRTHSTLMMDRPCCLRTYSTLMTDRPCLVLIPNGLQRSPTLQPPPMRAALQPHQLTMTWKSPTYPPGLLDSPSSLSDAENDLVPLAIHKLCAHGPCHTSPDDSPHPVDPGLRIQRPPARGRRRATGGH
jgi:hypothetical protein